MPPAPIHSAGSLTVGDEAAAVLADLQASLTALLEGLPAPIHRPVDLERLLGLDKKLAWQVYRVARSAHPLDEVQNLPARASMRRLLQAARKRHIPQPLIDKLDGSFARFDRFLVVHTSDRDGLVSLLSGMGGKNDDQFKLKVRKSLFRSAAHFWGMHAPLLIRTSIFHAKPGPEYFEDSALVQATINLERLRANQATDFVMMMRTKSDPLPGAPPTAPVRHPPELLLDFCSGANPQFSSAASVSSIGTTDTQEESRLRLPPGRTGAATLYSMQLHERISNTLQTEYYGRTFVTLPTEALVWELMIPVGWTNPATLRGAMYGCREHPEQAFSERASDRTPQQETVEYLGVLDSAPPLDGSPRHADAVRHVLKRLNWEDTQYDVFRCRVRYPVLHTVMSVRVNALPR